MLTSLFLAAAMQTAMPTPPPARLDAAVVRAYPHDTHAFTQGLLFVDGRLVESTGRKGHSRLREVNMRTGKPVREYRFADDFFAEGTALVGSRLITLTYKAGTAFVFDAESFEEIERFSYSGEGWGLTSDGEVLYMSNGTAELTVRDPSNFEILRRVEVRYRGQPLPLINELEWADGAILANVFGQDVLVRIDPTSGAVTGAADLSGLFPQAQRKRAAEDVLNGIAFEPASKRLFVTGKNWPRLFEITLTEEGLD